MGLETTFADMAKARDAPLQSLTVATPDAVVAGHTTDADALPTLLSAVADGSQLALEPV